MISQTEVAGGTNQYGFYAVPKALQPKKKYRDNVEDEYEEEGQQQDSNPYEYIEDREAANERELQRDYYVDEAPYPEFKPRERGLDFGVQIERGDLFDFELQVKPLIQILVGRSVVSAINELQEEKEKQERKNNLDKYQKKRNAQLMVTQRLEAKHKRKLQEAERRKLQKQVFVKNQKQAGKKIIGRRNAKQCLLGFKNQLFNELEDAGYLRSDAISDLKIKYEEWLYEKIVQALNFKANSQQVANKLIEQQEKRIAEEHKKAINQEMAKRQIVLDERQRVRKENEQRKEKKRIKKMRQKLNSQREPEFIRFEQLLERYEQVSNILKYADRSNGFSQNFSARQTVYISGGLDNYLLALLESAGKELSAEEIEAILIKIIVQSGRQLQVSLLGNHYDKVQQVKKRMDENKEQFMKEKEGQVKDLAQQISLDLSLLESTNTPIKSKLHNNFVEALLSIYLTSLPEKKEESTFELEEKDKKRLELVEKVILTRQEQSFTQRLEKIHQILRIHFEIPESAQHSQISEKKEQSAQEKISEQWIDIYDGEGWIRRQKEAKKQLNRSQQSATAVNLGSFENSFVFDERVLHYLQNQLQKLLDVSGGDKLKQYIENLSNIRSRLKKDVAVFDSELRLN